MKKKVQKTQKNQKVEKGQNFGKKSGRCKMFSFSFSLFLSPGLFLWGLFFPSLEPERGRSLRDRGLDTESRKTLWGLTGLGWEFRAPRTDLKKKSGKMQSVFGRFRQVEFLCLIVSHWGPLSVFRSVTFFVLKKKKIWVQGQNWRLENVLLVFLYLCQGVSFGRISIGLGCWAS